MNEEESKLTLECSVCFDEKSVENISFLPCIHYLCTACYDKLYKNECPFCRNKLREEQEQDSYDETENEYQDVDFEMLVMNTAENRRKKKNKRKVMKVIKDNNELIISINKRRNTYEILSINEN